MIFRTRAFRVLFVTAAVIAVLLAVALTAARLLFPRMEGYRGEVESWAGAILGQPVSIGGLDARWLGLHPEVILRDVRLLGQPEQAPLQRLERIVIELDLIDLLLHQRIGFRHLSLMLDHLTVQRSAEGKLHLPELRPGGGTGASEGGNEFASWLLRQGSLGISLKTLVWQDLGTGESYSFSDLKFELRNDGDFHRLTGDIALPAALGSALRVGAEVTGDPLGSGPWLGRLYLSGKDIALGHWLKGREVRGIGIPEGRLDFELWSEWATLALTRLEGNVRLGKVKLLDAASRESRPLNALQAWLDWRRLPDGWQFSVQDLSLDYAGHVWPAASTTLRYMETAPDAPLALAFDSGYLHLGDIADLLAFAPLLDPANQAQLERLRPQGEIRDLRLVLDGRGGYGLRAALDRAGMRPWERLPGFTGLSGRIDMNHNGGAVTLDTRDATLDWPAMFRASLPLARLDGRVDWQRAGQEWVAYSDRIHAQNPDLRLDTRLEARLPVAGGPPFLDIETAFAGVDGRQVSRYLPVGVMSEKVVAWLDQGIQGGRVPAGTMIYHGRTRDFPFRDGQGRFEVDFGVEQAAIVPNPGWPGIEDIRGRVRFAGASMDIDVAQARIYQSKVGATRVAIADMKTRPALLTVDGRVEGELSEQARYVRESPLRDTLSFLDILTLEGPAGLHLQLNIPLAAGNPPNVLARLQLPDNRVVIKPVDLELTGVKTELLITETGVEAREIGADLYGHPVTGQVVTRASRGERETLLDAHGTVDGPALSRYFRHPFFSGRFSGATAWDARLTIPYRGKTRAAYPHLRVTSDLDGMAVDLHPPLGKAAGEARALEVDAEFPAHGVPLVRWVYGPQVSGVLAIAPGGELRGELRLGGGRAQLPAFPGISVAGAVPQFSVSEWNALLAPPEGGAAQTRGTGLPAQVTSLDVRIGAFEFMGQQMRDTRLLASRGPAQWTADIDSREMSGKLQIPLDPGAGTLSMNLDHWTLGKLPEGRAGGGRLDMNKLPPLKIASKRFRYADMDLGSLDLATRKEADAYILENLEFTPPGATLRAQGQWTGGARGQQRTAMELKVTTTDAGRTMEALGFAGTVKGGEGRLDMNAAWPGTPFDFEPGKLSGDISVDLAKGRLLDLEPGAGRIFGLLSLQTLPRRMTLDFSDLFSKGFAFDHIRGGYAIDHGIASTTNLVMDSPSARIDIDGRVDLARRRYDQHVLVTPHVSENLPLLGLLAASPQVGAVILLAQRLFRKELEKITQFEYTISGPWDAPVVERTAKAPKAVPETKMEAPTITE